MTVTLLLAPSYRFKSTICTLLPSGTLTIPVLVHTRIITMAQSDQVFTRSCYRDNAFRNLRLITQRARMFHWSID